MEVSYGCPNEKYPLNGIFQWDQAKALKTAGNEVVFVAIDTRSIRRWRKWGMNTRVDEGISIYDYNFPIGPIAQKFSLWRSKRAFAKALRMIIKKHGRPDVVHVHFSSTGRCVVDACSRFNIPYVLTEHSSGINQDNLSNEIIEPLKEVYQNAAGVIAVSSVLAKRIKQYFGVEATVIPNIVDMPACRQGCKKEDYFKIVSAGRLSYEKGFDVLIDAFKICIDNGINAKLVIMGEGPEKEALQDQVKTNHLEDKVTFHGEYSRIQFAEELSDADVFALASRGETFGVVYAEALACGVPVIATRCGGPEDFVNEFNGALIDVNDTSSLNNALTRICNYRHEYDIEEIVNTTIEKFSDKGIAQRIECVLNKAIIKQ